ncbi:MAG TPA: aromatic amino acid lyase [Geminicoccus sp.]|uniref:aromatic amino acid lyase n=1 Tax=Geminicoccus sp. TaxID=2024832 RepID=UPI002C65342A|nr:aromatic amino acid lyase [Geminicoccus sp.]HWL67295.1 aromatic amino acid lyase [Geminicoccus sp.]
MTTVCFGAGPVGIQDIVRLARGQARTVLAPTLLPHLARTRQVLDHAAATGTRIYGLNTGLGAKVGSDLAEHPDGLDASAFQAMLVRGRAVGVGEPLPAETVRAAIAARCAMLAVGGSGLSPGLFSALCALLDRGVHPQVPRHGSIGESDLGLFAHVALVLIGEGQAEHRGVVLPGGEALRRASLEPARLAPKDGLSLINASPFAVGAGALLVDAATRLLDWQEQVVALSFVAASANRLVLEPAVQAARPATGQAAAAARLAGLLAGSDWPAAGLQDPLSFRCAAPVLGAGAEALSRARQEVELELGSAADNPLVLAEAGLVLSTGNFAAPALVLAFENLGLAMAQVAQACLGRFLQLTGGRRAGLPLGLSPIGGMAAGLVPLQKTAMALMGEIRRHAAPVMLDWWPVAAGVEDHATQAPLVVEKAGGILTAWRHLVAIELLAAAQALDLQDGPALGDPLARLQQEVRARVAFLSADRPPGPDAQALHDWIAAEPPP